jgi:poly(A) polymerase
MSELKNSNFDFRKKEDLEKFDQLSIDEKKRLAEEAHGDAILENEKRGKLKENPAILQLEKWEPKNFEERLGFSIVDILQKNGNKAFFVGGYTRDLLMHKFHDIPFQPNDVDVTTDARCEEIKKMLTDNGFKIVEINPKYGTLKAFRDEVGEDGELKRGKIDVATFRTEGEYADGRHPDPDQVKFVENPMEDVIRRDFTINALLFDPIKKQIVDYVGGIEDVKNKNLRFVGDQDARIKEDKSRMLRYVRFLTKFNFNFSREIQAGIKKQAHDISEASDEGVREEMEKMLQQPNFWSSINNLYRVGILPEVLPELAALFKMKQSPEDHAEGDAYRHTLEVLRSFPGEKFMREAQEIAGVEKYSELAKKFPNLIWAGLFHDLGKAETQGEKIGKDGKEKITFYGHEEKSAEIASTVCRRSKFSNKEREDIEWLISRHMTITQFPKMKISKQKRLMLDQRFPLLLLLHLGDSIGSFPGRFGDYEEIKKIYLDFVGSDEYKKITENGKDKPVILLMNGSDLKDLGLFPGPKFKIILTDVEDKHLGGEIKNKEEALEYVKKTYIEAENSI